MQNKITALAAIHFETNDGPNGFVGRVSVGVGAGVLCFWKALTEKVIVAVSKMFKGSP
jgi:hypothetical protein